MRKRIISLVLAFCIVISLLAVPALAADTSYDVNIYNNSGSELLHTFTIMQASANLISFTIDGTNYQAEEGMTWAEWCSSSYNTAGFYVYSNSVSLVYLTETSYTYTCIGGASNGSPFRNDTIISGWSYSLYTGSFNAGGINGGGMEGPSASASYYSLEDTEIPLSSTAYPYLSVTNTGVQLCLEDGTVENYSCIPYGIAGLTYLGLSSSANQTTAEYPVGSQIPLTGAADFYIVTEQLEAYSVNIYTINGLLVDTLEGYGDSTLTVNSTSLVLTRSDGTSVTYEISLGTDETFLGLSGGQTQSQYYGVDWPVGETISLNCSIDLYLVSEYPYPVAIYFNPGVVIKYFTGVNSCVVRVNETSVDFISHNGTTETIDIPLSGDDTFWGLALSPNQKTPTYRPGSIISIYGAKNFFIVRQSDYNKLVIEENTTDIGEDEELEADTSSLKDIFKDFKSFIKTNVGILRIIEIFRDENNYSWFTPETASQLDTAPSTVSTFSLDDTESDYEKYNMQAYDERLNLLMSFMGGDDE